ncbi:MAG: hypothetical protein K0U98_20215 [Deltaproteobacteria bacterium]|nr:hypothetical protein [Deltaproteobacteria bacterium]
MAPLKALIKRVRSELDLGRRPVRLALGGLLTYVARHFSRSAYNRILEKAPGSAQLIAHYRDHTKHFLEAPPVPPWVVREITDLLGCVPKVGHEVALVLQPSGLPYEQFSPLVQSFVNFVQVDLRIDLVKLIQSQTYDLTDLAKEVLRNMEEGS